MSLTAQWLPLALAGVQGLAPLAARSSHALAVLGDKAYIFGGELKPRTPIGDELLVLDLAGAAPRVLSRSSAPWPAPRVGATLVSHLPSRSLYLWGGRGGKDMAPLAMRAGASAAAREAGEEDVWQFDTRSEQWQLLATGEGAPSGRSYHAATVAGDTMYIHAGCPTKGRLETLHALDLNSLRWKQCADAPAPGRGGTAIAAVRSPAGGSDVLLRWGGFAGYELGGPLDVYDVQANAWTSHAAPLNDADGEPRKRSVHGFVPLPPGFSRSAEQDAIALLFFGEGEGAPAELGHDGAGKFLDDVFVLLRSASGTYAFQAVQTDGTLPQARGWFASGVASGAQGNTSVVLHGGLNEHNERLADAWKLELRASGA